MTNKNLITLRNTLRDLIDKPNPDYPNLGFTMDVWLTDDPEQYDGVQNKTKHNCGSVACIGGWTETLFGDVKNLGLNLDTQHSLFYPEDSEGNELDFETLTLEQAVTTIDKLIETGEVCWKHVYEEGE